MYRTCLGVVVSRALIIRIGNRRLRLPVNTVILLALLTNASAQSAAQSKDKSDPLKPFTTCKLKGGPSVKRVDRRPKSAEKYREIATDKGQERVSVLDGYRVMFGYNDLLYFFANVKIERSDSQSYAADKEVIIRSLRNLASTKQATKFIYVDKTGLNGFEHYGTDRDVIDVGGVMGTHVLFFDPHHLVITIYVLNQNKDTGGLLFRNNRRFNDINEYRVLRDEFLSHYTECLKRVAETTPEK
jgi:hypothetical protein